MLEARLLRSADGVKLLRRRRSATESGSLGYANVVTSVDGREAPSPPRAAASIVASRTPDQNDAREAFYNFRLLFGGREVRRRLQRQTGVTGQLPPFLPHIERLLFHRRKHRSDLLDVEIRRHTWIPGALDHRRQLAFLELLQRPSERIFDQGPIPVDAMVLVARAGVVVRTVPEVIKGQE